MNFRISDIKVREILDSIGKYTIETELILDGVLCQVCGQLMEDLKPESGSKMDKRNQLLPPPGYPRTCKDCEADNG